MLKLENVFVNYGNIEVLHGISIDVHPGEMVTIIGANGAGKSTTLKAISGTIGKRGGSRIIFDGEDITGLAAEKIVERGLCLTPEGRKIFPDLTVMENLEMGAYIRIKRGEKIASSLESVFAMFPILSERRGQAGKTLSGGEQQMLAIARSLMGKPKLLMLDEPSTGLAPLIVRDIFENIKRINQENGTTILLVEQNAKIALKTCDRGYVLKNGDIVMENSCKELLSDPSIQAAYLGEGKK